MSSVFKKMIYKFLRQLNIKNINGSNLNKIKTVDNYCFNNETTSALKTCIDIITRREGSVLAPISLAFNLNYMSIRRAIRPVSKSSLGIIVLATSRYFSPILLNCLKDYARDGFPIVCVFNGSINTEEKLKPLLQKLKTGENVSIFTSPRSFPFTSRIDLALDVLSCERVVFFTPRDAINPRSFFRDLDEVFARHEKADALFFSREEDMGKQVSSLCANPHISGLSGTIFRVSWLQERLKTIEEPRFFWIARHLFAEGNKGIFEISSLLPHRIHRAYEMTVPDIAHFFLDSQKTFDKAASAGLSSLHDYLSIFEDSLSDILETQKLSKIKLMLIASLCARLIANLSSYYNDDDFENIKNRINSIFDYGYYLNSIDVHAIHQYFLDHCDQTEKNTVAVIETFGMQDLRDHFVEKLKEKFSVIYLFKPQYYVYHYFNCLVLRSQIQRAGLVLSSNDMHTFITSGKPVVCLWHGLGMLKEVKRDNAATRYPMDRLVTSSKGCCTEWARSFDIPEDHVLPLGNVLTDMLFNRAWVAKMRHSVRAALRVDEATRLVFFAPTFRVGSPYYYDPGIDLDHFGDALAERGFRCVTKRHHVFSHILRDTGVETSNLRPSANGAFMIDEQHDFIKLLCACDVFMTDYSSGIFYATLMDKPLVLYAPDWTDYQKGPNGFMIPYPEAIPAAFVGEASLSGLLASFAVAEEFVGTEFYRNFKEEHVGMCDGHSSERVISWVHNALDQGLDYTSKK